MKTYSVSYNEGVGDGLCPPRNAEEKQANALLLRERLAQNWRTLEASGALVGITILSRQEFIGALCVMGQQHQIDALKKVLHDNAIGTVLPNGAMFGPPLPEADPV